MANENSEKDDAMSKVVGALVPADSSSTRQLAHYEDHRRGTYHPTPEEREAWQRSDHGVDERLDLSSESLHVQAAYRWLKLKGVTLWADFIIATPLGRLKAARWLAHEFEGVDAVLKSDWNPE